MYNVVMICNGEREVVDTGLDLGAAIETANNRLGVYAAGNHIRIPTMKEGEGYCFASTSQVNPKAWVVEGGARVTFAVVAQVLSVLPPLKWGKVYTQKGIVSGYTSTERVDYDVRGTSSTIMYDVVTEWDRAGASRVLAKVDFANGTGLTTVVDSLEEGIKKVESWRAYHWSNVLSSLTGLLGIDNVIKLLSV